MLLDRVLLTISLGLAVAMCSSADDTPCSGPNLGCCELVRGCDTLVANAAVCNDGEWVCTAPAFGGSYGPGACDDLREDVGTGGESSDGG